MNVSSSRSGSRWTARLAWAILLLLAGAALATWGLSRWEAGARILGVAPHPTQNLVRAAPVLAAQPIVSSADATRMAALEGRLAAVERETAQASGSAGRADALLVAFAARRAVERGVALGYLEPLLVERFGAEHQRAVATVVTFSRKPVTLDHLTAEYEALGPILRGPGENEGLWTGLRRELGSIVTVRRTDSPNPRPQARFDRAMAALRGGKVDLALAETMRLPGANRAEVQGWVRKARGQVEATRSLDELESAALLGQGRG